MTWTAPMTAVANTAFTAAQFNLYVRDNLNETAPAKATAAGQIPVSTGANAIAMRTPSTAHVTTSQTTTSTSYADLTTAGPAVTVTTGAQAIVIVSAHMSNDTAGARAAMSYAVSGATSVSASDEYAALMDENSANRLNGYSRVSMQTGMTPGSNTFTAKYRVNGNTGAFSARDIIVVPL